MKPGISIKIIGISFLLWQPLMGFANNIVVSNISLTNRNTSTQTVRVNFNLSWDNSWRTTSAPFNWDAAWVFVKYKVGTTGEWKHATLATSGHTLPGIAASTQTDATGIFIYRSAAVGSPATFNPTGIQLQWNYGIDGVADEARIFVRVFAIEMVYNQVGGFQAGSGAISNGEFRRANDVTASAPASTFTITGSLPTFQSNNSSSSPNNIAAYNNTASDLTGTTAASLNAGYPTGFDAFYSMKYEISQQQYVDFLNTLTYTQQATRTATAPNSTAGTGALINPNDKRNGIDIQTPGTASTVPAVYACNLNASNGYNDVDDGQHIACNYLSWDDLTAYLDWAGLRPMTELEHEKSCRGNLSPVAGEYPWGSTSATALSGLTNAGLTSEIASNAGANIAFTNAFNTGPVRNGIFATGSSNRSGSGAGYYGNMELGGNLWERVVTVGNPTGRTFSGAHGNGTVTSGGASDVSGWPAATGSGWKGGAYDTAAVAANSSGRTQAANGNNNRVANAGGRGVRTVTTGIVTNGLILWLDAGITPSYPGSGTTWTDLSGNRNDGALSGPTYSSLDGGSLSYTNATNVVTVPMSGIRPSTAITQESWVLMNNSVLQQVFIGAQYGSSSDNSYAIWYNGSNNWAGGIRTSSSGLNYQFFNSSVSLNVYYHFVHTYDGSTQKLYLNGTQVLSWSTTGTITYDNLNTQLAIGNDWNTGYNGGANAAISGRLATTRIYDRALSASEVLQNFNAQKARFGL